jgi:hypothetical protein
MQKALFLTLLLAAAVLGANTIETGPTELQVPPWQHLWDGLLPVDPGRSGGSGGAVKNPEPDRALQGSGGTKTPGEFDGPTRQDPGFDWGGDILVGAPSYKSSGRISVDNDTGTGDIFVCLLNRDTSVYDTAHIWRSTDGGATWHYHPRVTGGTFAGHINDAQILCGYGPGDTTWLYFLEATSGQGLRIRRTTPDGLTFRWKVIDTTTTIVRVALDRNTERTEHLFCVWEESDGDIRAMSSTDAGATWAHAVHVSSNRRGVSFAAGGGGYGYIAYMDDTDSSYYLIARFDSNLVSSIWKFSTVDSASDQRFREVAIAADRTAPGDSQVAIALATCRYTGNDSIYPRYSWTLNGGTSWSSSFWPVTDQARTTWLAHSPRIRRSYDSPLFRAIVSMPETTAAWDTIVYAYTTASDPTSWAGRGTYNDHRNTDEASHDLGYSSLDTGGFITYRQYGASNVWFDGWSNYTGIIAAPTPVQSRGLTTVFGGEVNLMLPKRSRVNASVYDLDGRLVRELINGTLEAGKHRLNPGAISGVCFLRVTVDGGVETAKLVHLQ